MAEPSEVFFEAEDYALRIEKVREAMAAAEVDLLVTTHPAHVCYLVGHFTQAVTDLMFLALPAQGRPLLQLPQFERPRYEVSGIGAEVTSSWNLGENPVESVSWEIRRRALDRGRIGVDVSGSFTRYRVMAGLVEALGAKTVEGLVDSVRLVKSPAELAYLREAAVMSDAGTRAALDAYREGAVDYAVAAETLAAMVRAGCDPLTSDPYICIGWRSAAPHTNRGGQVARAEDSLFIELGATRARYTAPLIRCAVATRSTPALDELAEASDAVIEAVCATVKAGTAAADVAAAGYEALVPVLPKILWHHTYGYPVGLGFPPTWLDCPGFLINERNHRALEAGMVFHLPTQLRVDRRYGAGFSETIVVTETGCERLSKLPRELVVR